jgi:hypothetical protein
MVGQLEAGNRESGNVFPGDLKTYATIHNSQVMETAKMPHH